MNAEPQFYPNPGFMPCGENDLICVKTEFLDLDDWEAGKIESWKRIIEWRPSDHLAFMWMPKENPLPVGNFVEFSNHMVAVCHLVNWKVVSNFGGKYRIRG